MAGKGDFDWLDSGGLNELDNAADVGRLGSVNSLYSEACFKPDFARDILDDAVNFYCCRVQSS